MMKLVAMLVVALMSFSTFAVVKVGIVDMQKVIFTVKEGQKVRKKLEVTFNKKKAELKKEEGKLKKAKADFDKKVQVLSQKAQITKQQDLQKMLLALESKRQKFQKEIRDLESKLTEPIVKRIYGVIAEVSKKEKVDVAFEVSTTPVIYAASKVNLTNKVIDAHNKKHPGK